MDNLDNQESMDGNRKYDQLIESTESGDYLDLPKADRTLVSTSLLNKTSFI